MDFLWTKCTKWLTVSVLKLGCEYSMQEESFLLLRMWESRMAKFRTKRIPKVTMFQIRVVTCLVFCLLQEELCNSQMGRFVKASCNFILLVKLLMNTWTLTICFVSQYLWSWLNLSLKLILIWCSRRIIFKNFTALISCNHICVGPIQ